MMETGRQTAAVTENGKPTEGYRQEDKGNNDSAPQSSQFMVTLNC